MTVDTCLISPGTQISKKLGLGLWTMRIEGEYIFLNFSILKMEKSVQTNMK